MRITDAKEKISVVNTFIIEIYMFILPIFSRVLAVIRKYGLIFIQDNIYLNDLKDFLFNYVFTFILIVKF